MKKSPAILSVVAGCFFLAGQGLAGTTNALFNFDAGTGVSTDTDPNSTAGTLTIDPSYGPGTKFNGTGLFFAGGGPDIGLANESTAISLNRFVSFSLTAKPGFAIDLNAGSSALTFDLSSDSAGKAVNWALLTSVNGFASPADNVATGSVSTTTPVLQTASFAGLGTSYDHLGTVSFRLYLWNGTNAARALMDNVQLADAVAVPEPGSILLAGCAGMVLLMSRRRTR